MSNSFLEQDLYFANLARSKLEKAAVNGLGRDINLRVLVCHANFLDKILEDIDIYKMTQLQPQIVYPVFYETPKDNIKLHSENIIHHIDEFSHSEEAKDHTDDDDDDNDDDDEDSDLDDMDPFEDHYNENFYTYTPLQRTKSCGPVTPTPIIEASSTARLPLLTPIAIRTLAHHY
ncbi:hypothetical protein TBLA_0A03780 [Henningerozyma blattae CBS 6284]|uniref:Uncharacterized protein n=1 Tax=Henningerozyma blattae (strain ATCC 34711 / CBS 6284 / DSM 70876 / NBRC 10599 / NRRL Y-10934 / UCD 77-7) TaxID=1071380 RepID=I2GVM4_HENB6|nr:hypothetical protein TBLA_0A03780 [Tetrapisispora blattae CBS 6284]CCH58176.1 hypothetical protein TBLA_0A03780 [Tetrapisispora blattae CBS 6284]